MPFATIRDGQIRSVYLKPNPLVRLAPDERMVRYDPPEVDLELFDVQPMTPVVESFVSFTVTEKPDAAAKRLDRFLRVIDSDVDRLYNLVVGNREIEYKQAELEALQFKAANFDGAVPSMVEAYAEADNLTAKATAESILAKATEWRQALAAIRAARLHAKAQVRAGNFEHVRQTWPATISELAGSLNGKLESTL